MRSSGERWSGPYDDWFREQQRRELERGSTTTTTTTSETTSGITSTTSIESGSSSTGDGVEACIEWCTANLDEAAAFTDDWRDAWAGMHACVGVLSCEDFAKDPPAEYPCLGADEELSFECKGQ